MTTTTHRWQQIVHVTKSQLNDRVLPNCNDVGNGRDHSLRGTKPNRKLQRLKEFDYSTDGAYFVTICTHNRENIFGEIQNGKMILNMCGEIVQEQWKWLGAQYPFVLLDEFCVMPNHFHGIIWINHDDVRNSRDHSAGRDRSVQDAKIKPIPELIGAFKTTASKRIHRETDCVDFSWQKSFHDRIVRNDDEMNRICEYILGNPQNWKTDKNNLITV